MFVTYNLHSPAFIEIPTSDTALVVLIMKGKNNKNDESYWSVIINEASKKVAINQIYFKPDSSGIMANDIEVNSDSGLNTLKVKLLPEGNAIDYSWTDNDAFAKETLNNANVIRVGRPLPAFTVKTLNGDSIRIADFRNRMIVINWWGTWCKPCVEEIPSLNTLVDKYGKEDQFVFIAIASDPVETLHRFLKKHLFKFWQTLQNPDVVKLFGNAYPRTIIVDSDGTVIYDKVGGSKETRASIEQFLDEWQSENRD